MSLFDKAVAAVTPSESQADRAEARERAKSIALPGDWLATILDHHLQLEDKFAQTKAAPDASSRQAALKALGVFLTGHAIAEESAIYPALASGGDKGEAELAYDEQVMVKMQMAELEKLDPMSQAFLDKLEHIREAVAHHMYEEEGTWFPHLAESATPDDQRMIAKNYGDAFGRFVGEEAMA